MRKTKLKILSILILTSLLAFIGCNDDDLHSHNHEAKAGIKSSKITFKEFKKHTKAFNLVADVNKKQNESNATLNKIVKDTVNNFTIDTQEGLYLQYANLHSFTFPIRREVDNGKLENLVLSYQNNGSYKVKILQYDLTAQEKIDLELDQLKTIQNPIITIPIENFDTNLVVNGCEVVTELVVIPCSQNEHTAYNLEQWWECTAAIRGRVYAVSRIECLDSGGSTGGSDFPTDDGIDYGMGGEHDVAEEDYTFEFPEQETDPEAYEEGISAPVKPFLDTPKTPCAELLKMTNNYMVENALDTLKNFTGLDYEKGYSVKKSSSGILHATPCNASDLWPDQISMPVGGDIIGAFHTHPHDSNDIVPMFSDRDIKWLYDVMVAHDNNGNSKNPTEYFLTLTVPEGTYAIKIKNIQKFRTFMLISDKWSSNWELKALRKKYDKRKATDNIIDFQNDLLSVLKDSGVGLYEANEDLSGWSELEQNENTPTAPPTKKACN